MWLPLGRFWLKARRTPAGFAFFFPLDAGLTILPAMSGILLFEDHRYRDFLPLTYWRSVMSLRCGRKSLLDNAAFALRKHISGAWTRDWIAQICALRCQVPTNRPAEAGDVLVNARWVLEGPHEFHKPPFVARCGDALAYLACDEKLARALSPEMLLAPDAAERLAADFPNGAVDADLAGHPWDLIDRNGAALNRHWTGDDRGSTGNVSSSAYLMNPDRIHVGDRTRIRPTAVIDAGNGPVYISNDVHIDVHAYIEGPAYIGPGSIIKPHTSIRAGSSLGTMCKIAGEIGATIIQGYTNKQHDGFLGHAYVGSWVNLGAGTSCSNLKNTYGEITAFLGERALPTGKQFAGAVIGDFVRTGIGQLLPTGAVIGFGAMVATGGFCPKYVPSLAWLTPTEQSRTDPARLRDVAGRFMERRRVDLLPEEFALIDQMPQLVETCGV